MANDAGWKRVLARPDRLWWLLPIASTTFVVTRLWSQSSLERLDFHIYYEAVNGWQPGAFYDYQHADTGLGFTYPPISGLVLRPVTMVPFDVAELLWLLATAVASLTFLVLAARRLPARPRWKPVLPALVAVCMLTTPVWLSLRLGQINGFLALAVLADVLVVRRRWAGALVGICGAIKLTPMYAALYFVAAKRWRALAISVGAFAAATLVAWAWMPTDSKRYWTVELFATERVGDLGSSFNNSTRRLIEQIPISASMQTVLWLVAALALTGVALWRARIALDRSNPLAAITIVMCAGLAVAPISWSHHVYFLLPAVLLLVGAGTSVLRDLGAAALLYVLIETRDPGQDAATAGARAVALILIVAFLPIDHGEASVTSEADGTGSVDHAPLDAVDAVEGATGA